MSFGGIGNILGQIGGMALTPAMETYIQDYIGDSDFLKGLVDDPEKANMLENLAGGTLGTVLGTGLNAGLGYLTGGKSGAAAGALEGLVMSGGAALQHDKFKEAMGMGDKTAVIKQRPNMKGVTDTDVAGVTGPEAWSEQARKSTESTWKRPEDFAAIETAGPQTTVEIEDNTQPETSAGEKKPGYFELAGQLGMPAWGLGMGLGSSMDYASRQEAFKKKLEAEKAAEAERMQQFYSMLGNMYKPAYAEGGGITVSSNEGAPTSVTFPDWFVDEFAHTGGLGGYATGGYINPEPMNPDTAYPQSMIPRAQPYPGAAPIRHEVVNMERGGLLEGDGDGMSDHIPANIDGKEKVRVADGEFVVPADIAKRYGEDRLHAMMNKVRSAAHAKKGKQIVENAGKRAFIQSMSRVKA
jgi:hypothetical protein